MRFHRDGPIQSLALYYINALVRVGVVPTHSTRACESMSWVRPAPLHMPPSTVKMFPNNGEQYGNGLDTTPSIHVVHCISDWPQRIQDHYIC